MVNETALDTFTLLGCGISLRLYYELVIIFIRRINDDRGQKSRLSDSMKANVRWMNYAALIQALGTLLQKWFIIFPLWFEMPTAGRLGVWSYFAAV